MMKTVKWIGLSLLLCLSTLAQAEEQAKPADRNVRPFSNFAVGINAGLAGFGASVATPLCNYLSVRGGFSTMPIGINYTYDDLELDIPGLPEQVSVPIPNLSVDLNAKLKMNMGHLIFDFAPFKRGDSAFFIAAGLYFTGGKLLTVSGQLDDAMMKALKAVQSELDKLPDNKIQVDPSNLLIEVGDTHLHLNEDGGVSADLKVFKVRPYVGLGFGRAIPKRRVGFRFELGCMFHGSPNIDSKNVEGESSKELDDANKFLKNFKVYPQMNFHLTVRLLKNK